MKRRIILAAALAAALVLPASASAAGSITGGPAKIAGGYSVFLNADDGNPDRLTIMIERGDATDAQTDILTFTSGVKVTLSGASASIRGTLGSHGSVDLRLRGARTAPPRVLPKGCTGSRGTTRNGRLEGRLRLRLPTGKFVTIRSLPASTFVGGELDCEPASVPGKGDGGDGTGDGNGGEPQLMLVTQSDGLTVSFVATKRSLMLSRIGEPHKEGRATVMAMTSVTASGSNLLTVSGGGASAGVRSAGRFSGAGVFTATTNMGSVATGPLTGSLKVAFDGGPAVNIAGDPATLLNGDKA